MKFKTLEVKKFRHIQNQTIEFGEMITAIAGQNSTGKSSLLGWVAQACHYKGEEKTITGQSFKSKYSEIFRFCPDKDYPNNYEVTLLFNDGIVSGDKKMVTRYEKVEKRYRVDFDGRGTALDFPILYLGLKRLIPLATEKNISEKEIKLDSLEKTIFSKLSKEILILLDKNIDAGQVKSTNKNILSMKTEKYGHLGNSAGQDNIGQIIASLLSFKRIKNAQGENFKGGILLIDEIDASLYAGSQIKLVENLYKFSRNNNIQVIFTTHSLEILEYLSEKYGDETKINFLELKNEKIKNLVNPSIQFIKNKITTQIGQKNKIEKIEVLCEDKETEVWCKNLVQGTDLKNHINITQGPFSEGTLSTMAESKHPIFRKMVFVLDGDCREKYLNKELPKRTVILPGECRPESMFYSFLNNLSDDDNFWNDIDNFTRQTCFSDYSEGKDKGVVKRWFKDDKFKPFFGKGYSKLFNRWKKDNKEKVLKFQDELKNSLNF